jgi:alpha-beta hydrolase superfamily lysophospholipase
MPKTYQDYTSWKKFQPYFPEEFRIKEGEEPNEEFWKWSHYNVHIDRYIPDDNSRNIKIILVHGGGGNGRLLSPIGVAMRSRGFECVAPDMPGFGLTKIGRPNSYNTWIDLVDALVDKEVAADGRKVMLVGISLGGMLSYHVACRNKNIVGLMVTSLADATKPEVQIQLSKNDFLGKRSYQAMTIAPIFTDNIKVPIKMTTKMWAMANDQSFVKLLKRDIVGSGSWVYLKFFRTLMETSAEIPPEEFDNCPVLFFQPEKDFIIPWEISKPYYDRLTCEKEVIFLKNCGHIPLEEPGVQQLRDAAVAFIDKIDARG